MKFSFDLFNGSDAPSQDFKRWISGWWYRSEGIRFESGSLPNGDEWLMAGNLLSDVNINDIINRMRTAGIETLFKIDGQFILVLHSKSKGDVEIYRDRTGILPCFYAQSAKGIILSLKINDAKELAAGKAAHSQSLFEHWPIYRVSFFPDTPFDRIKSLSGRHSLSIRNRQLSLNEHQMALPMEGVYKDLDPAAASLGEILSDAVKKRITGQKGLGAWLSGGNDSSLLVALIRKHYSGNVKTVFVTFEDYQRNYRQYAKQVADKFNTEHTEIQLNIKEYLNLWAETVNIIQAPLNHPGIIGQTAGLKSLSGKIETIFAGEGADTVFGGPYWAPMLALSHFGGVLPLPLRDGLLQLSKKISDKTFITKVAGKATRALGTPLPKYLHSEDSFGVEEEIDKIFGTGTYERAINARKNCAPGDLLKGLFSFHMLYWIPLYVAAEILLGFEFGIQSAYPFLDYELMQGSLRLPVGLRYHYSTKKAVLKRYCLNFFDKEFVYKPKEGFGVPLSKWFSKPEFTSFLNLPLEERSLKRGWWNEKELKKIIDLHRLGGGTDKSAESIPWITTNLELWARICLDGDSPDLYKI
ncbi:MAG: hypothetical protein HY282_17795 [Nitrospirae bacterium]|nr:hypothetical protein [Candidatus Manganitrophaceae bacterium]